MDSEAKTTRFQYIEDLSCSALMYMNINCFSNNETLYKNKEDAYNTFVNSHFFHDNIPYTLETFKKDMREKIYPFCSNDLSENDRIKSLIKGNSNDNLQIKFYFLCILANAFAQAVYLLLYKKNYSCKSRKIEELAVECFELDDDMVENLSFPQKSCLHLLYREKESGDKPANKQITPEYEVTKFIMEGLEKYGSQVDQAESLNCKRFMSYFLMLYLWNIKTLVACAYLIDSFRFKQEFISPNFLWYLWKDKSSSNQNNKIIKSVEIKILNKWALKIYRAIVKDCNSNIIDSIQTISEYDNSKISKIIYNELAKPLIKNWKAKGTKDDYHKILYSISDKLKRKDNAFFNYSPKSLLLDSIGKHKNPILSFLKSKNTPFKNLSNPHNLSLNDIIYKDDCKLECPLQLLQLPRKTIRELFKRVDFIAKNFHLYLRNKLKNINADDSFRLDDNVYAPLYRRDFNKWKDIAANFIIDKIIRKDYITYYDIKEECLSNKELLAQFAKSIIAARNELTKENICKENILRKIRGSLFCGFINGIDKESFIFKAQDSNDLSYQELISHFEKEIPSRRFDFILFLWWLCGYTGYLKNGILKNNVFIQDHYDGMDKSGKQNKIFKRIGFTRLLDFQMQTCNFAKNLYRNNHKRDLSEEAQGSRSKEEKRLDDLIQTVYEIYKRETIFNKPLAFPKCTEKTRQKCSEELIARCFDIIEKKEK